MNNVIGAVMILLGVTLLEFANAAAGLTVEDGKTREYRIMSGLFTLLILAAALGLTAWGLSLQ